MRAFLTKIATALLGAAILVTAGQALACDTGCPPPAPPTPPSNPSSPNMPCNCGGNHGGGGGHVNVNAHASAQAFSFASSGATYGGGYSNWSQAQGIPATMGGLQVETGEAAYEAYAEQETYTRSMVIEASCIDDTGVPHPASQLNADHAINKDYAGEVYRCIAGTHMQVTMASWCDTGPLVSGQGSSSSSFSSSSQSRSSSRGMMRDDGADDRDTSDQGMGDDGHMDHHRHMERHTSFSSSEGSAEGHGAAGCHLDINHINFDGGKTLSCQKGEALWFEHGQVSCKVQIQQRQCNERSLLRRFGTGIKIVTLTLTESVTKQRQMASSKVSRGGTTMIFDGGVGGYVQ